MFMPIDGVFECAMRCCFQILTVDVPVIACDVFSYAVAVWYTTGLFSFLCIALDADIFATVTVSNWREKNSAQ